MWFPSLLLASALLQVPSSSPSPSPVADPPSLATIRRIFVESFGDDEASRAAHGTVISALVTGRQLIVTENRDRADAILKGSAVSQTTQEFRAAADGRTSFEGPSSTARTETTERASVSLRLVSQGGDLVWAVTRERKGGKLKGAIGFATDDVIEKLLVDLQAARGPRPSPIPK